VQTCIWPSWCHCHSLSLASVKSRLVLPFWYRITRVVPDKGPLNVCVCVCVRACVRACVCLVLWHCWLGIRPVKHEWWGVGVVICLEQGTDFLHMVQLMPLHPRTPPSFASFKSRLVLSCWYWLTQVVVEKRSFSGCSSSVVLNGINFM